MDIVLNDNPRTVPDGMTVADLVATLGSNDGRSIAVAVNDTFVPKGDYPRAVLKSGDNVVIIGAAYGG